MTNIKRTSLILLTAASTAVVALVIAVVTAYSGCVDVSATSHSSGLTRWFLTTTRDHSISAGAKGVVVPPLDDPATLAMGADHYQEMCVTCHGAPGIEPSEVGQGLEPPAPKLPTDRPAAETYWVVKNGIRMTGMPAFGKTHDDHKIWAIVAFVERLRGMTPGEYRKLGGGHDDESGGHHRRQAQHEADGDNGQAQHDEPDGGHHHGHAGHDDEHAGD